MKLEEYTVVIHEGEWEKEEHNRWTLAVGEYTGSIWLCSPKGTHSSEEELHGRVYYQGNLLCFIKWTATNLLTFSRMKAMLEETMRDHNKRRQDV